MHHFTVDLYHRGEKVAANVRADFDPRMDQGDLIGLPAEVSDLYRTAHDITLRMQSVESGKRCEVFFPSAPAERTQFEVTQPPAEF